MGSPIKTLLLRYVLFVAVLLSLAVGSSASEAQPNLEPVSIGDAAGAALSGADSNSKATLRLEMFGKVLILNLEDSGVLTSTSRNIEIGEDGVEVEVESSALHYSGTVEGDPDSWVRISESNGQYVGLIKTEGEIFVVEPSDLWALAQTSSSHVAYRLDEVDLDADLACGVSHAPETRTGRRHRKERRSLADAASVFDGAALQGTAGGFTNTEIALVGDYEYFAANNWPGGYTAWTWLEAVTNAVAGIYEQDVGVSFIVASNTIYTNDTASNVPFPLTPTGTGCQTGKLAGDVLAEFAGTRGSGQYPWSLANSDVAHLFTGRPLCGSGGSNPQFVIGIAYFNGICANSTGTGVSEDWSTGLGSMSILVAHELGHNFNAGHTSNCSPHSCCVMESGLGGSCVQDRFSSGSISTITSYAASRTCLDSGPPPTPTDTFTPSNTPTQTPTPTQTFTPTNTPTPPPPNLALGQPVRQSSTAFGGNPELAVDGDTNGAFGGGSVTHTDTEAEPWWEVDLGAQFVIEDIEIWNRTDCCSSQLSNYYVMVSNTPDPVVGQVGVFQHFETDVAGSPSLIPIGATGRFLRIQKIAGGPLSLAEVRIFGQPLVLVNLAAGQTATQSTTAFGGEAGLAIDGDTNGVFGAGSVTHTETEDGPWWEVDLGERGLIETIDIWNRTDCCGENLSNYWVLVSNSPNPEPGSGTTFQLHVSAAAGSPTTIAVNTPGRYVRIKRSVVGPMSIAEVTVWGQTLPPLNLAQGKSATQSSTAFGGEPEFAADGNLNGLFWGGSVTHTESGMGEWWEVDLGTKATIQTIDVWNRTDCCGTELTNYYVLVSNSPNPEPGGSVTFETLESTTAGSPTTITVNAIGRYVRIKKSGGGPLSLTEVQVWGQAIALTNLAQGQSATQSSTAFGGVPSLAVDGNVNGDYGAGSVTHTDSEPGAWWEVDLGADADIDSIDIFNRTDCCGFQLKNYYVMVSDTPNPDPSDPPVFVTLETTKAGTPTSIPVNATGRYVRIQRAGNGPLSIAEVLVLGDFAAP